MIDVLLSFGLSNLCISALMAGVAWGIQRKYDKPLLAHLLWLLVLIKLLTPNVFTLPLLELPTEQSGILAELEWVKAENAAKRTDVYLDGSLFRTGGSVPVSETIPSASDAAHASATPAWLGSVKRAAVLMWLVGTLAILVWSLLRIVQFQRLLRITTHPADPALQQLADKQAQLLGMSRAPQLWMASAKIPPMVWWIGSQTRILLPTSLVQTLPATEVRWLIAHEVAHVRRRDHWVRWMEWLACVAFWWNPVTWIARKHLRVNEEICCDALVLSSLKPNPKIYANSLLNAVEFLTEPLQRPPAMASEINSGGALEKRLKMIIRNRTFSLTPRWVNVGVLLSALLLLPLGVAHAQEPDTQAVAKRLIMAVQAGEITEAQATAMMGALAAQRFQEQIAATKGNHKQQPADQRALKERAQRKDPRQGGMSDKYHEAGVSRETYTKVMKGLHERGVKREVLEPVMGILLHSIYATQKKAGEGVFKELDMKMTELGLTRPQSEMVFGYAKKLSQALADRDAQMQDQVNAQLRRDYSETRNRDKARYDEARSRYEVMVRDIKDAVKAGAMSRQEAKEKMARLRERMENFEAEQRAMEKDQAKEYINKREEYHQQLQSRVEYLKYQVDAGQITDKEARQAIRDMETRVEVMQALQDESNAIMEAHKAGKISKEEAHERLSSLREHMDLHATDRRAEEFDRTKQIQIDREDLQMQIQQRVEHIKKAVESGEMSREEAKKQLEQLKKHVDEIQDREAAKKASAEGVARFHELNSNLLNRMNEINLAMEAGEIEPEVGEQMLADIKAGMKALHDEMNEAMDRDLRARN